MKAITITEPGKIRIAEIGKPEPREGEALLRVLYCGVCGADVASFTGNQPFKSYPLVNGHEISEQNVSIQETDLVL